MAYNLPPPWDPGFALPQNVRDEGLQRRGFVTKQMPRGSYDNPSVGYGGFTVPQYVKDEGYIHNSDLAALVKDGSVCAVKYAIVRHDPRQDAVLADLVQRMGPDLVISGIGERPVLDHFRGFGLRAFTSGSTCVAPALSNRIREALHAGDFATASATRELFIPLEDMRDAHSPIRILHAAVQLAGIAQTGPIGEFLSVIEDKQVLDKLKGIALELLARNQAALARPQEKRIASV